MLLIPGECIEIQRGARKAKFHVYWMGARGTALEGQAGIRGVDPGKSIWSVHLPPDELDISVDTLHLRSGTTSSGTSASPPHEQRQPKRYAYSGGATLRAPGSNYPVRVHLRNIHLGGLFVESATTLPLDTVVKLELQIEGVALETAGRVINSVPRVGMEIGFHRMSAETRRKIVLGLQKLKQKAWDEQQVPVSPELSLARSEPPASANGVAPSSCVSAARALIAICKALSADFDFWKSTRTAAEIEELREAVAELQEKLAPALSVDIGKYLASGASKPSRQV
jgi:PilZ domain-containing protein